MEITYDKEYVVVSSDDGEDIYDQMKYYQNLGFYIKSRSDRIVIMERDATDEPAKPDKDYIKEVKIFAKTDNFLNVSSLFSVIKNVFRKKNK